MCRWLVVDRLLFAILQKLSSLSIHYSKFYYQIVRCTSSSTRCFAGLRRSAKATLEKTGTTSATGSVPCTEERCFLSCEAWYLCVHWDKIRSGSAVRPRMDIHFPSCLLHVPCL